MYLIVYLDRAYYLSPEHVHSYDRSLSKIIDIYYTAVLSDADPCGDFEEVDMSSCSLRALITTDQSGPTHSVHTASLKSKSAPPLYIHCALSVVPYVFMGS